ATRSRRVPPAAATIKPPAARSRSSPTPPTGTARGGSTTRARAATPRAGTTVTCSRSGRGENTSRFSTRGARSRPPPKSATSCSRGGRLPRLRTESQRPREQRVETDDTRPVHHEPREQQQEDEGRDVGGADVAGEPPRLEELLALGEEGDHHRARQPEGDQPGQQAEHEQDPSVELEARHDVRVQHGRGHPLIGEER